MAKYVYGGTITAHTTAKSNDVITEFQAIQAVSATEETRTNDSIKFPSGEGNDIRIVENTAQRADKSLGFDAAGALFMYPEPAFSAAAAAASETAAGLSETAAAASETAAGISETNASNSASAAGSSETNAGNSASAASASETAAGLSETAAALSETNAGNSETAAGLSEAAASGSEAAAFASEAAADFSATAAALSQSGAATSASTATTQAGIATTQAGLAADSAADAAASASLASTIMPSSPPSLHVVTSVATVVYLNSLSFNGDTTTLVNAKAKFAIIRIYVNGLQASTTTLSYFVKAKQGGVSEVSGNRRVVGTAKKNSPATESHILNGVHEFQIPLAADYSFDLDWTFAGATSIVNFSVFLIGYSGEQP